MTCQSCGRRPPPVTSPPYALPAVMTPPRVHTIEASMQWQGTYWQIPPPGALNPEADVQLELLSTVHTYAGIGGGLGLKPAGHVTLRISGPDIWLYSPMHGWFLFGNADFIDAGQRKWSEPPAKTFARMLNLPIYMWIGTRAGSTSHAQWYTPWF